MRTRTLDLQKILQSRYLILLISLLVMILVLPFFNELLLSKIILGGFFLFILAGISYGVNDRRHMFIFILLGLVALGLNVAAVAFAPLHIISKFLFIIFYLYAMTLFCKHIYASKVLTADILLGSVCIYLLIGIIFSLIYMLIQAFTFNSIVYLTTNTPVTNPIDFYYFSFTTLTTVGFGDIVIQNGLGKSIVIIESVIGTFYIAIIVARLVALFRR